MKTKSIWQGKGYIRAALVLFVAIAAMTWEHRDIQKQKIIEAQNPIILIYQARTVSDPEIPTFEELDVMVRHLKTVLGVKS